jgi:hypothetical protein
MRKENTMSVFTCYGQGIQEASRRPKIIALLWIFNIVCAAAAYFLFAAAFGAALGSSGMSADMIHQTNMNAVIEFLRAPGGRLGDIITLTFLLVVFYLFVSIFLYGGILHVLIRAGDQERFSQTFFAGGGRFYGRFFRLTIYSLILWIPASVGFFVVHTLLSAIMEGSTNEQLSFILNVFRVVLALFLAFFIKMILDYARIRIATQDTNKVFQSLTGAVRFVFGRLGGTLLLYYLLGLTGWAAYLAFRLLNGAFAKNSAVMVLLGFVLAQLFIMSRGWLKIAYQSAELKYSTGKSSS